MNPANQNQYNCPGCGAKPGELHNEIMCEYEICPCCNGQLGGTCPCDERKHEGWFIEKSTQHDESYWRPPDEQRIPWISLDAHKNREVIWCPLAPQLLVFPCAKCGERFEVYPEEERQVKIVSIGGGKKFLSLKVLCKSCWATVKISQIIEP